jgi:cytochrome c biogenesis protein CcdA/glutaredoxin-related protein
MDKKNILNYWFYLIFFEMKKILLWFWMLVLSLFGLQVFATGENIFTTWEDSKYILFYAEGCEHCQEILDFLEEEKVEDSYLIDLREVRKSAENIKLFSSYLDKLWLEEEKTYVPFLVVDQAETCDFMHGSKAIAHYFGSLLDLDKICLDGVCEVPQCDSEIACDEHFSCQASNLISENKNKVLKEKVKFLGILAPAALADSINPCAFAVILLLLFSLLALEKNYKKALLAWLLFCLAVFLSYFLMGLGIFSLLTKIQVEGGGIVRYIVVGFALLIAVLNLKDFFWYGKGFLMEVPLSWRPAMQKIIKKVTSPIGAFFVGFLVSLFLLPCTSGPYFVVLGYLVSESANLQAWGYFCLFLYNIIFILPMIAIVLMISFWWRTVEDLWKLKNKYKRHIHLIVGILMLLMAVLLWFVG